VTEERGLGVVDGGATLGALAQCRRESERGDHAPGAGERHRPRIASALRRQRVECCSDRVEELGVRAFTSEEERDLRDGLRAREAPEIVADLGASADVLERAQDIEIAPRFRVDLRGPLRKKIETAAEPSSRLPRPARESRT